MQHRGVAIDDPRNAGATAYFKPKEISRQALIERLMKVASGNSTVKWALHDLQHGRVQPDPPLSQPLEEVDDPHHGPGTHPDIIERMWKLDEALPRICRWVFWGKPALVHPQTGIVFAVGFGTIGYVMRLVTQILQNADLQQASPLRTGNPGQAFDIGPAGPEWRFVTPRAPQMEWCRAAYEFAGEAAT